MSRVADIRKVSIQNRKEKGERKRKIRNHVVKKAENIKQEGNKTKSNNKGAKNIEIKLGN
jgi:hypothetical protein